MFEGNENGMYDGKGKKKGLGKAHDRIYMLTAVDVIFGASRISFT